MRIRVLPASTLPAHRRQPAPRLPP
jgi:hypothetical protein